MEEIEPTTPDLTIEREIQDIFPPSQPGRKEITKALIGFHQEVGRIKKDSVNPFFKSSYASLPDILAVIDPILIKHDLAVVQIPTGKNQLTTLLLHTSGESIEGTYEMTPKDNTPQGIGSTITYARRYALAAMLSLNIADEDDDGNIGSGTGTKMASEVISEDQNKISEAQKKMIEELLLSKSGKTVAEFEEAAGFKLEQLTKQKANELTKKLQAKTQSEVNDKINNIEEKIKGSKFDPENAPKTAQSGLELEG